MDFVAGNFHDGIGFFDEELCGFIGGDPIGDVVAAELVLEGFQVVDVVDVAGLGGEGEGAEGAEKKDGGSGPH